MSLFMKYFVLKPKGSDKFAAASRKAMVAYADYISAHAENDDDRELARQLLEWAGNEFAIAHADKFPSSTDERGNFSPTL